MKWRSIACGVALVAGASLSMPHAAFASDGYASYHPAGTPTDYRWIASYDDSTDNLCVRKNWSTTSGSTIRARLVRRNGSSPNFSVSTKSGPSATCTGNLPIPEDQPYVLYLQWYNNGWSTLASDSLYS